MRAYLVVHILEGKTSDGRLIYACGRKVKDRKGGPLTHVGRALIVVNRRGAAEAVTCEGCRRKWWHYCRDARPDAPKNLGAGGAGAPGGPDSPPAEAPKSRGATTVADLMVALTKDVDAQQRLAAFVAKWLVTSGKNPGADGSLPRGIHSAPALRPEEAGTSSLNTDGCDWSDAAAHHWLVANDDRRRFDKTCELSRLLVQVRRTAIEEARDLCLDKARELRSDPLDVEGRMSLAAIECAARVGASLRGTGDV